MCLLQRGGQVSSNPQAAPGVPTRGEGEAAPGPPELGVDAFSFLPGAGLPERGSSIPPLPRASGRSHCRAGGCPWSGRQAPRRLGLGRVRAPWPGGLNAPPPTPPLAPARGSARQGLVRILPGGPGRSLSFRCLGSLFFKTYMRHKVYCHCCSRESSPSPTPCCGFSSRSKRT